MTERSTYRSPLLERYASPEMAEIFGPARRAEIWRDLWLALAESQHELGLEIGEDALRQMRERRHEIDLQRVAAIEGELRHEVMAHVRHFGEVAPAARGVIHLGATSAFVMDNADLIQHREGLALVRRRLLAVIAALRGFALRHRNVATVGYTHFQPAQPTTVGKRASLWLQDLLLDLEEIEFRLQSLRFRGARGATGTEASFLALFDGDSAKVDRLNELIAEKMNFGELFPVSSQTYPRKVDAALLASLAGIGNSASKFANDLRLLQHLGELAEPFEKKQVGSSAMAHKRNPMRAERMTALARHLIVLSLDPAITAASQWLERSLDDSANKRIAVPEAYLTADAVLTIYHNVAAGLEVFPEVCERHFERHLPSLAAEPVLLSVTARGGDRQEVHERIRVHAMAAAERIQRGERSDLLERLTADPAIGLEGEELDRLLRPEAMVGRAPEQVDRFVREVVDPILDRHRDEIEGNRPALRV